MEPRRIPDATPHRRAAEGHPANPGTRRGGVPALRQHPSQLVPERAGDAHAPPRVARGADDGRDAVSDGAGDVQHLTGRRVNDQAITGGKGVGDGIRDDGDAVPAVQDGKPARDGGEGAGIIETHLHGLDTADRVGYHVLELESGATIYESTVINEYLEDAYPAVPLLPRSAVDRAKVRAWTKYVDDVPTEAVKIPSFMKNIRPLAQRMSDAELDALSTEFEVILGAVDRVQEVAKSDVKPTSHPLPINNVVRPDEVKPSLTPEEALSGAPAQEEQRFRVPQILGEE